MKLAALPGRLARALRGGLRWVALAPVLAWRYGVSPMLPPSCRFLPSCSEYAQQAISLHGPVRGAVLAARRIGRCHPWCTGGLDPVPPPR